MKFTVPFELKLIGMFAVSFVILVLVMMLGDYVRLYLKSQQPMDRVFVACNMKGKGATTYRWPAPKESSYQDDGSVRLEAGTVFLPHETIYVVQPGEVCTVYRFKIPQEELE